MWEESKHPRDDDGRFTTKNGTPAEHKRLREKGIISKEEEKELNHKVRSSSIKAETGYTITATKAEMKKLEEKRIKVERSKLSTLVKQVIKFEPIKLKIGDREIIAKFDRVGAGKIVYGKGKYESFEEKQIKLLNIQNLPEYIKTATYRNSEKDVGKTGKAHENVLEWHYFINEVKTTQGIFNIQIDVRDKGENQFVYFVTFKKK